MRHAEGIVFEAVSNLLVGSMVRERRKNNKRSDSKVSYLLKQLSFTFFPTFTLLPAPGSSLASFPDGMRRRLYLLPNRRIGIMLSPTLIQIFSTVIQDTGNSTTTRYRKGLVPQDEYSTTFSSKTKSQVKIRSLSNELLIM